MEQPKKISEFCQALYEPDGHCWNFKTKLCCYLICPFINFVWRFVSDIENLVVLVRCLVEQQLFNLIDSISNISIRFVAFDMTNMEVHMLHHNIKKISVWHTKPRTPNRCRADNAPIAVRRIIPHANFRFYFAFTILCMGTVIMLIPNFISISSYKFGRCYNDLFQIRQLMNDLHKVFNTCNILIVIFKRFTIQIGTCCEMNNIVWIEVQNSFFKLIIVNDIDIFP